MLDQLRAALLKRLDRASSRLAELEANPPELDDLRSKGNAFLRDGLYDRAEQCYRQVLSTSHNDVKALVNLGFVLKEQRRLVEARVYLKRALALHTEDSLAHDTHFFLGQIAEDQGQLEEAAQCFATAFQLRPDFNFARRDLCRVQVLAGKFADAQATLTAGMSLYPEYADFHYYQGNLHVISKRYDLAEQSYQEALRLGFGGSDIFSAIGAVQIHSDKHALAEKSYSEALRLGSDEAKVYAALGAIQYRLGDEASALKNFRTAVDKDPNFEVAAHFHAGSFYMRNGDYPNAISSFELALALNPDYTSANSGLLFCLSMNPMGPPTYQDAAQRYGSRLTSLAKGAIRPARRPFERGQRPLTIGFVSGEFKAHPVGLFLEGILREMDPARMNLVAYSNTSNADQITDRLRPLFGQWHEITSLADDDIVRLIRDHNIDILVDLGGHTGSQQLAVFSRRPAPVQVTWLGYFASTGVAEIDYILADRVGVPLEHTEFFSEKIWYLPDTRLCMTPPVTKSQLLVTPPPRMLTGHITFGCFQTRTKITDDVLSVWSRVLAALTGAILRLQITQMDVPSVREEFLERVSRAGIDLARVSLFAGVHWEEYLASYKDVDILLDTFPYPGGTTTAEALWMGVPTLTLLGDTMLSRQGASMLTSVGLDDWIAKDVEDYIAKAIHFAHDVPHLAQLRSTLREMAIRSPLFDNRQFAINLQDCFEEIFQSDLTDR